MELFVSYKSQKHEETAINLAKEFGLTCYLQDDIDQKKNMQSYFFIYQPGRSYIQKGLGKSSKDIYCNFVDWSVNFTDPLLSRCLKGLPNKFIALDTTAGFGKDALEIAKKLKNE